MSLLRSAVSAPGQADHQLAATRSTLVQLLGHIDSRRTAEQYLSHFTATTTAIQPFAVIKVGGAIIRDHLPTLASALAFFSRVGLYPVIVHGAGPQLNQILEHAGVEPRFADGIRVTDGKTLALARQLFLEENHRLVQALEALGVSARPLTAGVFQADYLDRTKYNLVGRINTVEKSPILSALRAACLPILTSMAETADGQVLSVNADLAASALARALQPTKVVYLAETGGLFHDQTGTRIARINLSEEYDHLMSQPWLRHGTRLKVRAAQELLSDLPSTSSVSIVHPMDLQREILAASGAGTVIERGTRISSITSAECTNLAKLEQVVRRQQGPDASFCVQEMRTRPFRVYYDDPSLESLAMVSFSTHGLPQLLTFPSLTARAAAEDMFLRITKDFPRLMWTVPETDPRLDWLSTRATGRFYHNGWVLLWYGLRQQEARQLILNLHDVEGSDLELGGGGTYRHASQGQ
ncbi:acetylglutamate kinase [Aspergillus heteromorphus CBS 117.55]|uniref:acetylglutamate kinase n=1 Tax=Aspergillus heteromorphus CBS 117.55 TaxID=1448321 RepID=A0A317W7Y6_9EURO|nr:acetylglutamate kinase [Aspergillus heteromorphus CBS 117.55]PWY82005.1 acetylglutamate kinase [Aspergillus heteromorphus CBS 117.55]